MLRFIAADKKILTETGEACVAQNFSLKFGILDEWHSGTVAKACSVKI
jgi:hypothetical protein